MFHAQLVFERERERNRSGFVFFNNNIQLIIKKFLSRPRRMNIKKNEQTNKRRRKKIII